MVVSRYTVDGCKVIRSLRSCLDQRPGGLLFVTPLDLSLS